MVGLLKLVSTLGLGLDKTALKGMAADVARDTLIIPQFRKRLEEAAPSILARLAKDGRQPGTALIRDKDGEELTETQRFIHDADYLLWKSLVKSSDAADLLRDTHFPKVVQRVEALAGSQPTPESLMSGLITAEVELTF